MLSKFNIEKPEYVLYKRGRARFEAERSVVSLPLLEACEERMRHLLAENDQLHASKKEDSINYGKIIQSHATELVGKSTEVFSLQQELKLLCDEVARTRLPVNSTKKKKKKKKHKKKKKKKNQVWTISHDLCNTVAVLYQLSY